MPKLNEVINLEPDRREHHYLDRMRHHSSKYQDFHWSSVELVVNLIYTCDVLQTLLARTAEEHGLSPAAFNVLMILSRNEGSGCPMHELGEVLLVSRANVTGLVDCLERKNFVERVADPADRRVRLVRITEAGQQLLETLAPGHYASVREMLKEIKDSEKAKLNALLIKLRRSVQSSARKGTTGSR
ncbi:MAG TPA: MarR family transcriptional regulator [Pyrinomonadaceae bacterium]|nr:MarR family transcriptional regulator [Pyrinomonadaceae bacterium]